MAPEADHQLVSSIHDIGVQRVTFLATLDGAKFATTLRVTHNQRRGGG
jgi:hypothetical protein